MKLKKKSKTLLINKKKLNKRLNKNFKIELQKAFSNKRKLF